MGSEWCPRCQEYVRTVSDITVIDKGAQQIRIETVSCDKCHKFLRSFETLVAHPPKED